MFDGKIFFDAGRNRFRFHVRRTFPVKCGLHGVRLKSGSLEWSLLVLRLACAHAGQYAHSFKFSFDVFLNSINLNMNI